VIVVASLALPVRCVSEAYYPTNIELIERAVRAAVDSMEVSPPATGSRELRIEGESGSEASWLIDSVLKGHLLAMGWQIQTGRSSGEESDPPEPAGFALNLRVVDLSIQYGGSSRRFLFGGKVVERIARSSIYYELVDVARDQIRVSSNAKAEVRDVVPASRLAILADSKYQFTSPELKKSQWDRYLEGGLVIAIIGVLVYLFYSNKTAS
jgi:hypothetical protein